MSIRARTSRLRQHLRIWWIRGRYKGSRGREAILGRRETTLLREMGDTDRG